MSDIQLIKSPVGMLRPANEADAETLTELLSSLNQPAEVA